MTLGSNNNNRGECPNVTEVPDFTRDKLGTFGTKVPYPLSNQFQIDILSINEALFHQLQLVETQSKGEETMKQYTLCW